MPDRDPWARNPAASMKAFAGTPWKIPSAKMRDIHQRLRSRDDPRDKPSQNKKPEWFERYRNMMSLGAPETMHQDNSTTPNRNAGNFIQTEINPGVAYNKTTKKFCILLIENGTPKPHGSFMIEEEGRTGFSGFHDMLSRGPHGVSGVARSAGNFAPPAVALLPEGFWEKNKGGDRKRPTTALLRDKGFFNGEPNQHDMTTRRPYNPEHPLTGLVNERVRPSTAMLASKGAWQPSDGGPPASHSTMLGETGNSGGGQNATDPSVGGGSLGQAA